MSGVAMSGVATRNPLDEGFSVDIRNSSTMNDGVEQYTPDPIGYPRILTPTQQAAALCESLRRISDPIDLQLDTKMLERAPLGLEQSLTKLDTRFEEVISKIEDFLTAGAAVPILGVLPAAAKVVLGTVQTVAAVATSFFAGLASIAFKGARPVAARAVTHIAHGLGNIVAGVIEAIPIVGTISWATRHFKRIFLNCAGRTFGQNQKFLAYKILVRASFEKELPSSLSFWLAKHTMVAV